MPSSTDLSSLINPEPLDQAAINGLMTKRPYLHWYEVRSFINWRRTRRRWLRDLKERAGA